MRPLDWTWHWYGWRTTDPEFDPTVPHAGDPDYVYSLDGSSRVRGTISLLPGSMLLNGSFTVTGTGPSSGTAVFYTVEYTYGEFITAEVVDIALRCTDGTVVPVDFTYYP